VNRPLVPVIPVWVPEAVAAEAIDIYEDIDCDSGQSFEVLSRLVSDERMKIVWGEIYERKRENYKTSEQFAHLATMTHVAEATSMRRRAIQKRQKGEDDKAKLLEQEAAALERLQDPPSDPRWSEQDLAAQSFLRFAFYNAIDIEPVFLTDLKKRNELLQAVIDVLKTQSSALTSLGLADSAHQLEEIISDIDAEVGNLVDLFTKDNSDIRRQLILLISTQPFSGTAFQLTSKME
jgi:hypothetical protein